MKRKKLYLYACLVVGLGVIFWSWAYLRVPVEEYTMPEFTIEKKLIIPQRPGVNGIIISGPPVRPLSFQIDLSRAGVRSLDWRRLESIDPTTDVRITARINAEGQLKIVNIMMEGHTEAGRLIIDALKTWIYTPYKKGEIRFWFHLPSKGKRFLVDTSGLVRNDFIPSYQPVFNGQIHLVRNLSSSDVMIGRWF
jgi:hypothetical protein